MNDKHTPGPWDYEDGLTITDKTGFHVALVNQYASSFGDNTYKANARLISAAPELLEQRDELLEVIEDIISDTGTSGYWWGEKARAVITKAKGEAQ